MMYHLTIRSLLLLFAYTKAQSAITRTTTTSTSITNATVENYPKTTSTITTTNCTIGVDCCVIGLDCDYVLSPAYGHTDYFDIRNPTSSSYAGQTLCIPAGNYRALALRGVRGESGSPVTVTNCGGRVVFDAKGWTPISAKGCRYVRITGSSSSSSSSSYGILATGSATHGVHFDEGCSDIEIDHLETHSNGYAGIVIRTYPRCGGNCSEDEGAGVCARGSGFVQNNTRVHHTYVHDVPGEGFYIGTSHYHRDEGGYIFDPHGRCPGENGPEPALQGVQIYNNMLTDIGMDAIQIGAAIQNVHVYGNTIQRFATRHKYGHSHGIGMNPGSTGIVHSNWIQGVRDDKSGDGDYAIVFFGHGDDGQTSRIYNNVVLDVVVPFAFYHREDALDQRYDFVHNTVYNFTSTSPIKVYCLGTIDSVHQPPVRTSLRNNVFGVGPNVEVLDEPYGHKKFYGNTNGIVGMDCLDYVDARGSNVWALDESAEDAGFVDALSHDFRLTESSLGKGTGVVLDESVEVDYDGVKRDNRTVDMGAYAYREMEVSEAPSGMKSETPTVVASLMPSVLPSSHPSALESSSPSMISLLLPSVSPSSHPSTFFSLKPSTVPSFLPSTRLSTSPSMAPSVSSSIPPSSSHPTSCTTRSECDDRNVCTIDRCVEGLCVHRDVAGCCRKVSDCEDDRLKKCVMARCVRKKCKYRKKKCNDGNKCTKDWCNVRSGACQFKVKKNCSCSAKGKVCETRRDCCSNKCKPHKSGKKKCG